MALVVVNRNQDELQFYLSGMSPQLEAFIAFANDLLKNDTNPRLHTYIYFTSDLIFGNKLFDASFCPSPGIFPIYGYTFSQIKKIARVSEGIIAIDPAICGQEIRMEYDKDTRLFRPVLQGAVMESSQIELPESFIK